jgi:hypothetical protein
MRANPSSALERAEAPRRRKYSNRSRALLGALVASCCFASGTASSKRSSAGIPSRRSRIRDRRAASTPSRRGLEANSLRPRQKQQLGSATATETAAPPPRRGRFTDRSLSGQIASSRARGAPWAREGCRASPGGLPWHGPTGTLPMPCPSNSIAIVTFERRRSSSGLTAMLILSF